MANSKKMTALCVLFFTTALFLGLTNRYLARETEKINTSVRTMSPNGNAAAGQPTVRRPSVSTAYRPVMIDAHNDPLAPVNLPKKDTRAHKTSRLDRPIYEPSQADPNILLQ